MKNLILLLTLICNVASVASLRAADKPAIAETKGEYVDRAKAELDKLSENIDALELKTKEAGASAKVGLERKLKALKARRKTAQKDCAKLKKASGKAWANLKTGVENGINDLKKGLEDVKNE